MHTIPFHRHPLVLSIALGLAHTHTLAADTVTTLPTISVEGGQQGALQQPATTGSRLKLTPLQTPASIDVITRDQIEERGDSNISDAITRSTGITSMAHPGNGNSSLSARGFTDSTSVMRLYDGTRQYGGVGVTFPFDTWSIDHIEVLRGPASVIYGEGAIGGVVNIVPKKPTQGVIQNEVQATVGTDNTQRLGLGSGGAINDKLSYRVDLSGERSDGWVNRGDSRNLTFSGALRLDVSPDLYFQLSHAQGRQEPMRYFGTPLVNGRQLSALREQNYNVADSSIVFNDRWTQVAMEWTPNADVTVRSKLYLIDSKRHWRNTENYAYDNATGLINRSGDTEIFHDQAEIGNTTDATFRNRVFGLKNQVSVGVDVSASSFQHRNNGYSGTPNPASVDPFNPVAGNYGNSVAVPAYRNKADQFAVFAEDRIELSDKWSVIGGLRYDHADVSRTNLMNGTQAFARTYTNVGWRLGTVYAVTPDLSLYGQYAEAADPVGTLLMITAVNSAFNLSRGKQLEVGIKQAFADRKGEWTLAAYEIRKNDLLARDTVNQPVQVGQQSSRGIEAAFSLAFAKNWKIDVNATVLDARYDDFSLNGVVLDGKTPPNVAEKLANVWLSWNVQPNWLLSGGMRFVGKRYADRANTKTLPGYATTDLALQWKADRATTVALRGFNVFDKAYFTTAYYNDSQWFYGMGRRVELSVHHRF
ncbi:TonB-dependent receptor [uncultured Oxalicibacterium sp.]|uniref:TonB-dependent receptor n=1 Tax=uncultured Oxalicibacterium sp. TaxID=1168540 RepID=UPI0025F2BF03|nr:TonB-dependent receptor [uncultured Oxalicibacterium sp.]